MTAASQTTACPKCRAPLAIDARFCGTCGSALAPTEPTGHVHASVLGAGTAPDMTGREIAGRYRILTKLGEGGMGAVYRAEQISLKRKVALKLLKPELSADPGLVRRFNAEAELAAKLNHPNTVTLYDFGQCSDGALFIAMEFIEGTSLRTVVHREAPLDSMRILHIVEQVCASLGDAHSHGIIHRDLKPDNIMLIERGKSKDIVRVLDFGIAKLRDEQGDVTQMPMTQAGDMLGTPQYMAPEQIRGEKVDARTDVYALGAMLYEMVTGRLPFEAASLMAILSKHLTEMPVPPSSRRADLLIPPELEQLIMDALQKPLDARPRSMEAMAERIAAVRRSLNASGPPPQMSTPAPASAPFGATPIPATQLRPASSVPGNYPSPSLASPPPGVPRRHTTPDPSSVAGPIGQPGQAYPPSSPPMHPAPFGATPAPGGYGASSPPPPYGATPAPGPYPAPFGAQPVATPHPGGPPGHGAGYVGAMPTPGPIAYGPAGYATPSPAPHKSRILLWVVLGGLVAAAGVSAFIWYFTLYKPGRPEPEVPPPGELDTPAVVENGDGDGDKTDPPGPVSPDFTTKGRRDFYGDNGDEPVPSGEVFNHPIGFQLIVPDGFTDSSANGVITWVGKTEAGVEAIITLVGMNTGGVPVGEADYDAVGTSMAASSGGTLVSKGLEVFNGVSLPTGIVDMGGRRAQYVVYHRGQLFIVLTAMFPPESFDSTAAFRNELFSRRIRLP